MQGHTGKAGTEIMPTGLFPPCLDEVLQRCVNVIIDGDARYRVVSFTICDSSASHLAM